MAYVIDLKLAGVDRITAQMAKVTKAADALNKAASGGTSGGAAGGGPFQSLADGMKSVNRHAGVLDKRMQSVATSATNATVALLPFIRAVRSVARAASKIPSSGASGGRGGNGGVRAPRPGSSSFIGPMPLKQVRPYPGSSNFIGPMPQYVAPPPVDPFAKYVQQQLRKQAFQKAFKSMHGGKKSIAQAGMGLLRTTRLGMGGAMPLVGQMADFAGVVLGLSEAAVSAVTAIGGLVVALLALAKAAMSYGVAFAQLQISTGSSGSQAAQLAGIGGASGIGVAGMGQMAQAFNDYLKQNPYAAAQMASTGHFANYGGPFGNSKSLNYGETLLAGIKKMLSFKTDEEARRFTMGGPLESLTWLRRADPAIMKGAMNTAAASQTPEEQKRAADAQVLLNTAMMKFQMVLNKLGSEVLPGVITFLYKLDWALEHLVIPLSKFFGFLLKLLAGITGIAIDKMNKAIEDAIKDDANAAIDQQTQATDRNTKALNDVERALNWNRQTYGGGPNAQNALPSRFMDPTQGWNSAANVSKRNTIRMGQIPI